MDYEEEKNGEDIVEIRNRRVRSLITRRLSDPYAEYLGGIPFHPAICNLLLEDLDYRVLQTFIVITKKMGFFYVNRYDASESLLLFPPDSKLRQAAIFLSTNLLIEFFFLLVIITNCIFLTVVEDVDNRIEAVFIAFYTFELMLKIIARGLILKPYTFLRIPSNIADFAILLFAYLNITENIYFFEQMHSGVLGLRAFQLLRALRHYNFLPGLQNIVNAIIRSLWYSWEVFLVIFLFLLMFAILGQAIFWDSFKNKCVRNDMIGRDPDSPGKYDEEFKDAYHQYKLCGNDTLSRPCREGYTCIADGAQPNHNTTGYNNIWLALLTTFRVCAEDTWETTYNMAMSAHGPLVGLYYWMVIFLGSFVLLNLTQAIVVRAYQREKELEILAESARHFTFNKNDSEFQAGLDQYRLYPYKHSQEILQAYLHRATRMMEKYEKQRLSRSKVPHLLRVFGRQLMFGIKASLKKCNLTPLQSMLARIMLWPEFELFITLLIIVQVVIQCLEYHGMSPELQDFIVTSRKVFAIVFTIEILLRLYAFKKMFWNYPWNIFDFIVVFALIPIDFFLTDIKLMTVKMIRVVRMIRIVKSWPTLSKICSIILKQLPKLFNLIIVLFIIMYLFALIGFRTFAHYYKSTTKDFSQYCNFKSFYRSLMVTFRMFCAEWAVPYWNCLNVTPDGNFLCTLWFLPSLSIFNFLLQRMFLAILVDGFRGERGVAIEVLPSPFERFKKVFKRVGSFFFSAKPGEEPRNSVKKKIGFYRLWLRKFFKSNPYECIILVLVLINCTALCLEKEYYHGNPFLVHEVHEVVVIVRQSIACFFTLEILVKLSAFGIRKFFLNFWNLLDLYCVVAALLAAFLPEYNNRFFSFFSGMIALRLVRVMRLMRNITRLPGLTIVVNTIQQVLPAFFNLISVLFFFYLLYALIAVSLFKGTFYKCLYPGTKKKVPAEIVNTRQDCQRFNYSWVNSNVNFDNILNAIVALYQVAWVEGWIEIWSDASDSRGVDLQPIPMYSDLLATFFFLSFIIIAVFFLLNLFICIVMDKFTELKVERENALIPEFTTGSKLQRRYVLAIKRYTQTRTSIFILLPGNRFQAFFYILQSSAWFKNVMMASVVCDFALMIVYNADASHGLHKMILFANNLFLLGFAFETLIRLLGLGRAYLLNGWNVFDLLVFLVSLSGAILTFSLPSQPGHEAHKIIRVLTVIRVLRLLRVVNEIEKIRRLILSVIASLPALINIGTLYLIFCLIFSIVGVSLFSTYQFDSQIDEVVNFRNVFYAMFLLVRLGTVAGYNNIFDSLLAFRCSHCPPTIMVSIFFMAFIFIMRVVLLSMFAAVVIDSYETQASGLSQIVTEPVMVAFYANWARFDPLATQFISVTQLSDFVAQLPKPLGISRPNIITLALLRVPVTEDFRVYCLDLLHKLINNSLNSFRNPGDLAFVDRFIDEDYTRAFPTNVPPGSRPLTTFDVWKLTQAARKVQRAWRYKKLRRRKRSIFGSILNKEK